METALDIINIVFEHLDYLFEGLFVLVVIIAGIRTAFKRRDGKSTDVPAVGAFKDLPGSITGINKYK